ncbi:MAG TPA: hypothetical protein VK859_06205 [bacterium]|jgi:hypothetical protein|nr:hypothetical protein [bacterium]
MFIAVAGVATLGPLAGIFPAGWERTGSPMAGSRPPAGPSHQ